MNKNLILFISYCFVDPDLNLVIAGFSDCAGFVRCWSKKLNCREFLSILLFIGMQWSIFEDMYFARYSLQPLICPAETWGLDIVSYNMIFYLGLTRIQCEKFAWLLDSHQTECAFLHECQHLVLFF